MAGKATRKAFGEKLAELGETHPELAVLDADLSCSTQSKLFGDRFPDRFFQMGISEANMIGAGAGLALAGKTVFVCSFGCFVTGRYDQVRMSLSYSGANVRVVGTHAGIGIGPDGFSQMGLEDINVMRGAPTMAVLQPADDVETHRIVEYLVEQHQGPAYLRLTRQGLPRVHDDDYRFEPGAIDVLRDGGSEPAVALLASGATVHEALAAADLLAADGIEATVVNLPSIRPLDAEAVGRIGASAGRVVTVEDHNVIGGVGTAVCEALAETHPCRVLRIGIEDFGESGDGAALYEKYGLSAARVAARTRAFVDGLEAGGVSRAAAG